MINQQNKYGKDPMSAMYPIQEGNIKESISEVSVKSKNVDKNQAKNVIKPPGMVSLVNQK